MSITKDIIKYKKYKDYKDLSTFECKAAGVIALFSIIILYKYNAYENYEIMRELYIKVTLAMASSLVAFLGIIFAGIALVINTLKDDGAKKINEINGPETVRKIMASFKFLVLNIALAIFAYLGAFLFNFIKLYICELLFFVIVFLLAYWFAYIVFYCVSLINNTIDIFFANNMYKAAVQNEKNLMDEINEVRIDFIMNTMFSGRLSRDQLVKQMMEFLDAIESPRKEDIKKYIMSYYQ